MKTKAVDFDRFKRSCFYCPCCGAVCLESEKTFKKLLDQKSCNEINRDFDSLFKVYYMDTDFEIFYGSSMTLTGAIEMASFCAGDGFKSIYITETKNEKETVLDL